MTLQEIKAAVLAGKTVHWASSIYVVKYHERGGFNVVCTQNDSCIGLTHQDGITMNGKPEDFYIDSDEPVSVVVTRRECGLIADAITTAMHFDTPAKKHYEENDMTDEFASIINKFHPQSD